MSTISSKQAKRQALVDPMLVLAILVLILAFLVLTPFSDNLYNSTGSVLGSFGGDSASLSSNSTVSFASDQKYWDANCAHGWSVDAMCETIVARSQSCLVSVNSAYCSQYENYLDRLGN